MPPCSPDPLSSYRRSAAPRRLEGSGPLFRRWYRFRVLGARNIPAGGPVIIAANHLALDGPVVVLAASRPVHALAKSELFAPPLNRIMAMAGQIPIATTPRTARRWRRRWVSFGMVRRWVSSQRRTGDQGK